MKVRALPLLEGDPAAVTELVIDELTPRLFVQLLDTHKALLLRQAVRTFEDDDSNDDDNNNNNSWSVEDFGRLLMSLDLECYPYVGGSAVRTPVPVQATINDLGPNVHVIFTANEAPSSRPILFHHELHHVPNPPRYIFFYCDIPAESGGETPLLDSTLVYRYVKDHFPDFLHKLQQHGVRYVLTYPEEDDPNSAIGRSYKNTYNVSTKEELEAKLSKERPGCSWEWLDNGCVRITMEILPAVRYYSTNTSSSGGAGNSATVSSSPIYQWAFANSIIGAYLSWHDARNNPQDVVRFGNMDRMLPEYQQAFHQIAHFMDTHRVLHQWKHGDVFAIQNHLVMHSRNPFQGQRRVLASIWSKEKQPPPEAVLQNLLPTPLAPTDYDPFIFGFHNIPVEAAADICYQAIQAGYRRLDCTAVDVRCHVGGSSPSLRHDERALDDGINDVSLLLQEISRGIQRAMSDGLIGSRQELFIINLYPNPNDDSSSVVTALDRTLHDLGLDYVDEYLVDFSMLPSVDDATLPADGEFIEDSEIDRGRHNTGGSCLNRQDGVPNSMVEMWRAMEHLVEIGRAKFIGVVVVRNNYWSMDRLYSFLSQCRIRPSTLQLQLCLKLDDESNSNVQSELSQMIWNCDERIKGIRIAVRGNDKVANQEEAESAMVEALSSEEEIVDLSWLMLQKCHTNGCCLDRLADHYAKTPAQILNRWAIQRNITPIISVTRQSRSGRKHIPIPTPTAVERTMHELRDVFDFFLTAKDMEHMDGWLQVTLTTSLS